MIKSKRIPLVAGAVMALILAMGATTAFAAGPTVTATDTAESVTETPSTTDYSYLTGQQHAQSRNDIFAQAELIEDEAEKEAFLAEQGVGEEPYSEEAAATYSYITGQQRGASYHVEGDDTELPDDVTSSYNYVTGQQRGASYHQQ